MKKLGIISDTHLKIHDNRLDEIIEKYFSDVDFIVHAGDIVSNVVLDSLYSSGKNIVAVRGNMDHDSGLEVLSISKEFMVETVSIGIIHGWGSPDGIRQRIAASFKDKDINIIIYGHTHSAFSGYENGIYFFNPGSPFDSRFTSWNSVGIITIDKNHIDGKIIQL